MLYYFRLCSAISCFLCQSCCVIFFVYYVIIMNYDHNDHVIVWGSVTVLKSSQLVEANLTCAMCTSRVSSRERQLFLWSTLSHVRHVSSPVVSLSALCSRSCCLHRLVLTPHTFLRTNQIWAAQSSNQIKQTNHHRGGLKKAARLTDINIKYILKQKQESK